MARLRTEAKNLADALDDAEQANVDVELKTIAERQPAAHEFRSFRSIAQPGSRAQQTNVKKPRKGEVAASDRGAQSKNRKSREKGQREGQDQPKVLDNGMVWFWHDGKHHVVR